jgi:bifunctional enzyme CysN/CysC
MNHSGNLPEQTRGTMFSPEHGQAGDHCPGTWLPRPRRANMLRRVSHQVADTERIARSGHAGALVWLTGLSGAGKSTLAMNLERKLFDAGFMVYVLDGDNLRYGLNSDLDFTPQSRRENVRRVGETAALFADACFVCIAASISPHAMDRRLARSAAKERPFFEFYLQAEIATCERRDPKGLYRLARNGLLRDFTGIDAPYDVPAAPDLVVDSAGQTPEACMESCFDFLSRRLRPVR